LQFFRCGGEGDKKDKCLYRMEKTNRQLQPSKSRVISDIDHGIPLRTGSLASVSVLTSLEIPNGAVKMHSCVRSGRALQMCDINWRE
jgi:hypothetical protein